MFGLFEPPAIPVLEGMRCDGTTAKQCYRIASGTYKFQSHLTIYVKMCYECRELIHTTHPHWHYERVT
jgi:hypothetical protein